MSVRVGQLPSSRRVGSRIVSGTRAAFGIGAGYEPQHVSLQASFEPTHIRGYFVDLRAKTIREPTPFVSGRGRAYGISATARAQRALGWWDRHLAGDDVALSRFLTEAGELADRAERHESSLLWRYDVDVPKYGCRAPWYSCMAQGQAASVFARACQATGEARWAEAALAAVTPLLGPSKLGITRATEAGPVFEECPSEPPSVILNGWIFALWGLWDVAVQLDEDEPMRVFEASTEALAHRLPEYDLGWWSRYSLFPGHVDAATPFYHQAHISQVDVMYRLTGTRSFGETLTRWRAYDRPLSRMRAVVTKTRWALVDARTTNARRGER